MFTLARFAFSLLIFAIVVWFAVTVPLGSRSLWGHLRAIAGTQAAHELAEGTKQEARKVAEKLLGGPDGGTGGGTADLGPGAGKPLDEVDAEDRAALDKLTKKQRAAHRK